MQKPDALWVQVLKDVYFPNTSFLAATSIIGSSLIWQGLCKVLDVIRESVCFIPRNGIELSIRTDPWIPGQLGFSPSWRVEVCLTY